MTLDSMVREIVGSMIAKANYSYAPTIGSATTSQSMGDGCSHLEILTGLVGLLLLISETLAFSKCDVNGIGHWLAVLYRDIKNKSKLVN